MINAKSRFLEWALVALFTFALGQTNCFAEGLKISGYYKNFSVLYHPATIDGANGLFPSKEMGSVTNRLRLDLEYKFNRTLQFNGAYAFVPTIQDQSLFGQSLPISSLGMAPYRVTDPSRRLYPSSQSKSNSFAILQNIDRAYFTVSVPFADIYIGRQAIAWGVAHVINPTDIIAPYTFQALDTEERNGVDAFRIRIPQGFMGELDMGYVAGPHYQWDKSAAFIREKFYVAQTDVSLLLIDFHKHLLAGVNLARSVGDAGAWLEAAYTFAKPFQSQMFNNSENYFRGSAGMDYNFSSKTYGFIELHYSTAGVKEPKNYYWNLSTVAYQDGATYLMGRQYLAPGIMYQVTPLVTFTGQTLYNMKDRSIFLGPQIEYNISQNVYVGGGAYLSFGKKAQIGGSSASPFPLLESEFGVYPDIYYTDIRIYF